MADDHQGAVLVIVVGNELRGDDGVGLAIARHVRDLARDAEIEVCDMQDEPTALLDAWLGRDAVVVADTMRSGAAPGTIRRLDVSHEPLPRHLRGSTSTHAIGLGDAVELARTLDRLPASLVVYAVEGCRFDTGTGLSDELRAVVPRLAEMVLDEANRLWQSGGTHLSFSAVRSAAIARKGAAGSHGCDERPPGRR